MLVVLAAAAVWVVVAVLLAALLGAVVRLADARSAASAARGRPDVAAVPLVLPGPRVDTDVVVLPRAPQQAEPASSR